MDLLCRTYSKKLKVVLKNPSPFQQFFSKKNWFLIIFICFLFFILVNFFLNFFTSIKIFDDRNLKMYLFLFFSSIGIKEIYYKINISDQLIKNQFTYFFILTIKTLIDTFIIILCLVAMLILYNFSSSPIPIGTIIGIFF